MSKDYMTGGLGKWITYANPTPVDAEKKNPWENALGRADQFAPIADVGGIALFRKQFTVKGLKAARVDATALGVFDIWVNGRRVGRLDENGVEVFDFRSLPDASRIRGKIITVRGYLSGVRH